MKINLGGKGLRYNVRTQVKQRGSGGLTVLSTDEEALLVTAIITLSDHAFPLDRLDLRKFVQSFLNLKKKRTQWVNNIPGKDWLRDFKKKHESILGVRKPELLTTARKDGFTPAVCNVFFEKYIEIITANNLERSPDRIFNIEETAQTSDGRGGKVFVSKKSKSSYLASADGGKISFTVMFCCSAAGEYMLPFTIYKGGNKNTDSQTFMPTWFDNGPRDGLYSYDKKGVDGTVYFRRLVGSICREA